ncbi:hypothetical protein PBY51_016510 [Eleginops maclovinus]|uniref:Uncharacterized protein n=1 Tax=Eleginops maclovinus TaxID=56733 RepID=A0AAN7XRG3_ELEMC|nr:hypothetical protein PBY51_016510 [Eleginops maclovinus]
MAESNEENNMPQRQGDRAVESAARNLVSLLLNTMAASGSGRPTETVPPAPSRNVGLSVPQEMARSFPGYFKSDFRRGKKRCLTAAKHLVKTSIKTTALHFYLLPKNISHTPLPTEELELLQAGMGRQTLTLPEDGDHAEISRLLADTFPKMEGLCGGWLLHKATGGSGRRKLTVIPPEAEGCSVKALRAMSAVHIRTCNGKLSSDETVDEVVCPICTKEFPEDEITVHASLCGGR